MMNRFIKLTALVLGILFLGYSCTDLDEVLEDVQTEPFQIPGLPNYDSETEGGVQPSVNVRSIYDRLRGSSATNGGYYALQTITSDEMCIGQKGGDWADGGAWIRLHRHTFGAADGSFNNIWNEFYGAIGEANSVLANNPDLTDSEIAQARVLRAWFYWKLLDNFGRIKIITTPGVDAPQSTPLDAFNFIESELLAVLGISEVTNSMDLSSSDLGVAAEPYIANRFTALALLARLYLNAEVYTAGAHYNEADWAASYIIDNGPYQLCGAGCSVLNITKRPTVDGDPTEMEGYPAVFAPNNQSNPEIIWSIYYDRVGAGGMNFGIISLHYTSQLTYDLEYQPWNGYQTLEAFYNSYEDGDIRKEANFLEGIQTDFFGNAILDFAADDEDLRIDYTPYINELEPNASRESGVRPKKFSYQILSSHNMNNDYPIFRLGQIHLLRGEARARAAGDWSLAANDVNLIRERAGLGPMASVSADSFLEERGREMYQESTRRTDLIRFGKWSDSWWEKTNSDAYRTLFPIPQPQIDNSNGTLTQNPGY